MPGGVACRVGMMVLRQDSVDMCTKAAAANPRFCQSLQVANTQVLRLQGTTGTASAKSTHMQLLMQGIPCQLQLILEFLAMRG